MATRIDDIKKQLMATDAASVPLSSVQFDLADSKTRQQLLKVHNADDAVGDMSVDEYLVYRLSFALERYRKEALRCSKMLKMLEITVYLSSGFCTVLVVLSGQRWIPTLISLSGVAASVAAIGNFEDKLIRTNQAILELGHQRAWWNCLEDGDQIKHVVVDRIIRSVEDVIEAKELGGVSSRNNNENRDGKHDDSAQQPQ